MAVVKMNLFKKEVNTETGGTIDVYFMRFTNANVFINTKLTNEVKKKMLKEDISLPCSITLDEDANDYFITSDKYINKYGEEAISDICVIQDYRKCEKLDIVGVTLNDYLAKKMAEN